MFYAYAFGAAKALYITQSTLSQQIKQLEDELDIALLFRNNHNVSLTEAGETFLEGARKVLAEADDNKARILDLTMGCSGRLNIGVTHSFGSILTETVMAFKKEYPPCCSEHLLIVLSFRASDKYDNVESHLLFDNKLVIVVRDEHPLTRKNMVRLSDLEDYDLVMPSVGLQARNTFDGIIVDRNLKLKIAMEANEVNTILNLLKKSNFVTVLSETTILETSGVTAIEINDAECSMEGCLSICTNRYRKRSAEEFIRLLSETNALKRRANLWL